MENTTAKNAGLSKRKAKFFLDAIDAEDIFTKENIKKEYKELALLWHPDRCTQDNCKDVFIQIDKLYKQGVDKLARGYWGKFGVLDLTCVSTPIKKIYRIKYKYQSVFELGTMYVGDNSITYTVDKKYEKLFSAFKTNIDGLSFSSDRMKKEFSRFLPVIKSSFFTEDKLVLVLDKTPDVIPLSVLLKHFNGVIPPVHTAWIIGTMLNMRCFLHFNKMTHNAISIDNYFVSPEHHSGLLLGGWWYSGQYGTKLKGMPESSYRYLPAKNRASKCHSDAIDSELLRSVGRLIAGDENGTTLIKKGLPKPIADWLIIPGGKPMQDYKVWMNSVIEDAFGKREFVKLEVDINNAYKLCR